MPSSLNRLLVVTSVPHHERAGHFYAYGPYAREIDIWADLFPEVVIAAPRLREPPPEDAIAFSRSNISIWPLPQTGGDTLGAKLLQALAVPGLSLNLMAAMRRADAIHVRCPGNLGLLGVFMAPLFSRHLVAKYAGQWNGYATEGWTNRLQRAVLRSSWWHGPVTVYGSWPNQPAHVVPFFTSMMTAVQVDRARQIAANKKIESPLRVLCSGALSPRKRVDAVIEAVALARGRGAAIELTILGDGPERARLEALAGSLGLRDTVRFVGALPFDLAMSWYTWAHCLVLASTHSEGWPKVVAEGMCHGLLCIAVDHGQLSTMLSGRGVLLKDGSAVELATTLERVVADPAGFAPLGQRAAEWARRYSLEGLREELGALLADRWHSPIFADRVVVR
jgi:glycosyltransferase involved in cell wall biosynthesis